MNKRLFIVSLLIFTNFALIDASTSAAARRARARSINLDSVDQATMTDPITSPITLLDEIQQMYASQPDNSQKAAYINHVLDNNDSRVSVDQKLEQARVLAKIIDHDISLHSGWLYNSYENRPQISWLKEQQTKIANRISQLQWQAKGLGEQAFWQTATWTTVYLGIILAAYVAQDQLTTKDQYGRIVQKYPHMSYGQLAWMPLEFLLDLAKSAVLTTKKVATSETVQASADMIAALATGVKEGIIEAAQTIKDEGTYRLHQDVSDLSKFLGKLKPKEYFTTKEEAAILKGVMKDRDFALDQAAANKVILAGEKAKRDAVDTTMNVQREAQLRIDKLQAEKDLAAVKERKKQLNNEISNYDWQFWKPDLIN